jgi:hypothetical protein
MSDCGVNLAGVEIALKLMQRMRDMQEQIEEMGRKVRKLALAKAGDEMEDIMKDIIEDAEWKEV